MHALQAELESRAAPAKPAVQRCRWPVQGFPWCCAAVGPLPCVLAHMQVKKVNVAE